MKAQTTSNSNIKGAKNEGDKLRLSQSSVEDALERSIHELILLAKYYQKHGYLRQAQEIYYYILTLQERRDKRRQSLKGPKPRDERVRPGGEPNPKMTDDRVDRPRLKRTDLVSAYGMCALKRS